MSEPSTPRPWDDLRRLAEAGDLDALRQCIEAMSASDAARALDRLPQAGLREVLTMIPPGEAAALVEGLSAAQAAEVIHALEPQHAAAIVQELPSDSRMGLLGALPKPEAEDVLAAMSADEAEPARAQHRYHAESVGRLMATEFLAYSAETPIVEVAQDLQRRSADYRDYQVQYVYVLDAARRLRGVVPLRNLLLAPVGRLVGDVMIADPITISDTATLAEAGNMFEQYHFLGLPVLDAESRLVGVVRRAEIEHAMAERAVHDSLKGHGIMGGEELRSMPLLRRARRRLAWLSSNIGLNVVAASVIAAHQDTLAAAVVLAVFLPIISDMSGCSGNQAVAVSLREMTLGILRPGDVVRVWMKELGVGVINGLALGALLGVGAWLWQGSAVLGLVVGAALAVNTVVAVSVGGVVPLFLRRVGADPALASSPLLTTITDMCGFLLVLSMASYAMPYLGIASP